MLVPAGERALLAEQVADLPNFLGYWTPDALPESSALPAIANGYVTLGSFNRLAKIGDPVLRRWTAILRALPRARLVIKADQLLGDGSRRDGQYRSADPGTMVGVGSIEIRSIDHGLSP